MTAVVGFRLERDGRISSVTVEQSSGNEQYDHAARQAVQNAVPLPPFPPTCQTCISMRTIPFP